jgi:hypothetical protein
MYRAGWWERAYFYRGLPPFYDGEVHARPHLNHRHTKYTVIGHLIERTYGRRSVVKVSYALASEIPERRIAQPDGEVMLLNPNKHGDDKPPRWNIMCPSLTPHVVYRIADNFDYAELRGKQAVFVGWCERSGDIRRSVVRLLNDDGSTGEEYLVSAYFIIPLNSGREYTFSPESGKHK